MLNLRKHPERRGFYLLEAEQFLPRGIDEVFSFFADAANLQKLTPSIIDFQILTPLPITMRAGALIDYRLRLHGFPLKWRTEISDWEPPLRFMDRQLKGPYRVWEHEHRFVSQDGGTLVCDRVLYAVPGGALIHHFFVKRDVRQIFEYRQKVLQELFPPVNNKI